MAEKQKDSKDSPKGVANPFLDPDFLPHSAPAFDLLQRPDLFLAALQQAKLSDEAKYDAITENPDEPDFENTIEANEFAGTDSRNLRSIFQVAASNTKNEAFNKIQERHPGGPEFYMGRMFARIKKIYDMRHTLKLSSEERGLLEKTYHDFRREGLELSAEDWKELRRINAEIKKLQRVYDNNIIQSTAAYRKVIDDESLLEGVSQQTKDFYKRSATAAGLPGKWMITLSPMPSGILQNCKNKALRGEIRKAYNNIAAEEPYNNKAVVLQIVRLRHQKAQLLGYENYATFVAEGMMLNNTKDIDGFLRQAQKEANAIVARHQRDIRAFAKRADGITRLETEDYSYYREKMIKSRFHLDQKDVTPYFEMNRVIDGAFRHAEKLFNITFTPADGKYPVYHPDVRVHEVRDKTSGQMIGIFYGDYYARLGEKNAGAWTWGIRGRNVRNGQEKIPVVLNQLDFMRPSEGGKTYLTPEGVETVFHELGHAVQRLGAAGKYASLTGSNAEQDFTEVHSLLQEHWCFEKEVLSSFARHDVTGEPMSEEMMEKLRAARHFKNEQRYAGNVKYSTLDMLWHDADPDSLASVEEVESKLRIVFPQMKNIEDNISTNFIHIFSGSYAAGYYGYALSQKLSDNIFEIFRKNGLYDQASARNLKNFYAAGGIKPAREQFKDLTGYAPDVETIFQREANRLTASQQNPSGRRQLKKTAPAP